MSGRVKGLEWNDKVEGMRGGWKTECIMKVEYQVCDGGLNGLSEIRG